MGKVLDNKEFNKILGLERKGFKEEAYDLLLHLVQENHPLALLELSSRYISTDGYTHKIFELTQDLELSKKLALKAKSALEDLSNLGDGEALRMLAYTYLGFHGPYHDKCVEKAEKLLLESYNAGCLVSANDLTTLYVWSDIEKAGYWYNIAEKHGVRVILHSECEPYIKNAP